MGGDDTDAESFTDDTADIVGLEDRRIQWSHPLVVPVTTRKTLVVNVFNMRLSAAPDFRTTSLH